MQQLFTEKKESERMGAYAAAPVVNPNIRTMEQMNIVLQRIRERKPLEGDEQFYLMGNNHNHASNKFMLEYIDQEGKDQKLKTKFDTLLCIPMLWPDGMHGGFDFTDDANRIQVIRTVICKIIFVVY